MSLDKLMPMIVAALFGWLGGLLPDLFGTPPDVCGAELVSVVQPQE